MRIVLSALLLLATAPALRAQEAAPAAPIRAWFGPTLMFATDLSDGIGAGYDLRVTIERPDVMGVSVVLGGETGTNEQRATISTIYGALLAGKSLPVAQDAFLHLSAGLGYAQTDRDGGGDPYDCYPTCTYSTGNRTTIGPIVPIRAELHVPYRRDRAFGIVAQAMLLGDVPNRIGLGLHYSFVRTP